MKASFRVSRNIFQNDENLTFRRPLPFSSKQNKKKKFWKRFQGTPNAAFWLDNEETNSFWTNLEEIEDNCGTLLWIFSKSDNFQIKAGLDTMFDFFQLWETLQSELIARFLAVFSVFHTKKFFLGWYSFKFLILKFSKINKNGFFGMYYIQNGSKCDKWLCLVSGICNSALRSLKKSAKVFYLAPIWAE